MPKNVELNGLFYDQSWMLQLSEFAWTQRSPVCVVFNNFLFIDAKGATRISSDKKRLFFAVSLYPLLFLANTPFKERVGTVVNRLLHCKYNLVQLQYINIFLRSNTSTGSSKVSGPTESSFLEEEEDEDALEDGRTRDSVTISCSNPSPQIKISKPQNNKNVIEVRYKGRKTWFFSGWDFVEFRKFKI